MAPNDIKATFFTGQPFTAAPLGAMQRLIVSPLFLAEKTNGRFKKSQLPSQPRLQFGRNSRPRHRPGLNCMNAINVISPYKHHGMWVLDDPRVGLVQEPFVSGADTWIDRVVANIPNAEKGFTLIFSSTPLPGHQYRLDWRRAEGGGNWYYSADLDMEGWLCPALFQYFLRCPSLSLRPGKGAV